MRINIVLQYSDAAEKTNVWAFSERTIDFHNAKEAATRCTVSFAAVELEKYLMKTLDTVEICIVSKARANSFLIFLVAKDPSTSSDSYSLIPCNNGIVIEGEGRIGVLYGVYEFLKLQGWRWYEPGDIGEMSPEVTSVLKLPEERLDYFTRSTLGRGFAIEGVLKESDNLLLWMARNRLNVGGHRLNTVPLMRKLGIIGKDGGHIFDEMVGPDCVLPSGETVWNAHPEWYGTPAIGELRKENALRQQFCVSQDSLLEYLAEELLSRTMDQWHGADQIDIFGFDSWGSVCNCQKCKRLGNGTDQSLYMASKFRDYFNSARRDGRLDRDVKLVLCGYEGTSNLLPPENPVPQNLIEAGDYILFAPINRCYAHDFDNEDCSLNQHYNEALLGWSRIENRVGIGILEYYNVSRFDDLPILFSQRMKHDLSYYAQNGVSGFSYMHVPMVNWGLRSLTQVLFAELSWNPNQDADRIIREFIQKRYGPYAAELAVVYEEIERAWRFCTSWRAWGKFSFLSQMQQWDGDIPKTPLDVHTHFDSPDGFCEELLCAEKLLEDAMDRLCCALRLEKHRESTQSNHFSTAVNPVEQQKMQTRAQRIHFLSEDKRSLVYSLDTMKLMRCIAQYYNMLYCGKVAISKSLWKEIETIEDRMERYYVPIYYVTTVPEIQIYDALTRSQLKDTISKCRKFRIENKL